MEKNKKLFSKEILLILTMVSFVFISGCGIGEKKEKQLFDAMKKNGLLDLNCEYEDYDEVRREDQSPIPAVFTYYDYKQNGKLYTIDYRTRNLGENDSVYMVRVTIKTDTESDTSIYYFEKETFAFREKK